MRSRLSPRRLTVGGVAILLVVAAGVTAWAATNRNGASYRTALVQRGSVQQALTTTGEISPIDSAGVDFQVAGTVAKIRTAVGHRVVAGQTLARLDRASLRATLNAARSEVTTARQQLSEDENGEDNAAGATSTTSDGSTSTTAGDSSTTAASIDASRASVVTAAHLKTSRSQGPDSNGSGRAPQPGPVTTVTLTRDQNAIRAAQRGTDAALATAKTALAAETATCTATPSGGSSATTTTTSSSALSCTAAARGLLHDETVVDTNEMAEDNAEQVLGRDLSTAEKTLAQQQTSKGSAGAGHRQTPTRSASVGSTVTVTTAASIATDQATIDQARAVVATAKASLEQATLTAPISGRVTAVTITKGDTVSGASSATQPAVEIVGSRQDRATVYLSDTQVRTVKVGMAARVTPDGFSRPVAGRVVAIGVSGTESASGSVSYPVTVDIATSTVPLVSGADAAVWIRMATAKNVIAVPTSAVHYQGATTYVEVLRADTPSRQTVKVSTVGPSLTEVVSGLTPGQRVVLADLDAAVPSSSTTVTGRAGFTRFGGFGAGAGFGAGRGGFGPGAAGTFVAP